MFGLGLPEIVIILIVALLVVGPAKLPELAKTLGKAFNDFRKMADEVKETFDEDVVKEDEAPKKIPETKEPQETAEDHVPTTQETAKNEPPEQSGKTDAKAT
jgi:Tat protein translocase TatB subunit